MNDKLYEREALNCLRNEMTHIWTGLFILGGGAISLFLGIGGAKNYILAYCGLAIAIILFVSYFIKREILRDSLEQLERRK